MSGHTGEPYDYERDGTSLETIRDDYPNLWATIEQGFDLPDGVLWRIAALVLNTCPSCHDAPAGCQCWDDE